MTAVVRLVEAKRGRVARLTELCTVSGKVPVYADDGRAARANGRSLRGCRMRWQGRDLEVGVRGALAATNGPRTFAVAGVGVVPPDARPLCSDLCGPQPLADASGEISVDGAPRFLKFGLLPNPVSLLNAKPTVWLEADVEFADHGARPRRGFQR